METVMSRIWPARGQKGVRRWLFGLGVLLLGLALAAFVYEFAAAGAGGHRTIAAGELWFRLHSYSLNLSQAIVQRYLHPGLWDPLMVGILQWPAWSILGAPGAALVILSAPWPSRKG